MGNASGMRDVHTWNPWKKNLCIWVSVGTVMQGCNLTAAQLWAHVQVCVLPAGQRSPGNNGCL